MAGGVIQGAAVAVADPDAPQNAIRPNADGSINVREGAGVVETPVVLDFNTAGDQEIVPAVPGEAVSLYRLILTAGAATNITFKDGPDPQSGPLELIAAGSSIVLDDSGDAWYESSPGNALIINSSNAVQISGTAWITQR